jgi:hypothetical protein
MPSLEAKIILAIGYSFRDEHINGIITQALRHDRSRVLLAVSPSASTSIRELGGDGGHQYKTHDVPVASFLTRVTIAQLEELAGIQSEDTPLSGAPQRRRSPVGEGPTQGGCWLNLVACERPSRETGQGEASR